MKCQKCQKREATEIWVGTGGMLDFAHGSYEEWCEICVLEEQIKFAKRSIYRLPFLERKLHDKTSKS